MIQNHTIIIIIKIVSNKKKSNSSWFLIARINHQKPPERNVSGGRACVACTWLLRCVVRAHVRLLVPSHFSLTTLLQYNK